MEPYAQALTRVIADIIEPGAAETDATGSFPRKQVDALANAGILGLTVPAGLGGGGAGLREAATVVRELGAVCGSTAMIVTMHYAATAALAATAAAAESAGIQADIAAIALADIAAGRHLSTLAFSESGSRSHFWAPLGTAVLAATRTVPPSGSTPARAG